MSLDILDTLAREDFETVLALHDRRSGARAFLVLDDTSGGPAFGGIRRWSYIDEAQALRDCLRLARGMTLKCALADLPAGGGKLVLLDRGELDLPLAYRFIGEVIERQGGRYYSGPDVGTTERELSWVAERTRFVTDPGENGPGELAAATCAGVIAGIEAALVHVDGEADWSRRTVLVQGLGEVGARVAKTLRQRGAHVLASEIDGERGDEIARELDIELVEPTRELEPDCDVFAPCALGGIVHDLSLVRLRCRIIAGAANNVLATPEHGDRLHERGVLYVPDFAINAGALIRGARFHLDGVREPLSSIGGRIGRVVEQILSRSREENASPVQIAQQEAQRRVERRRAQS
jgi:leucine dehydrogenase